MKFEGATMRDAIAKVKAELGDQAVIISTRQVRRGLLGSAVEISAAIDTDDAEPAPPPTLTGPTTGGPQPVGAAAHRAEQDFEKLIAPLRSELRSLRALVRTTGESRGTTELRGELAVLRKLVEQLRHPAPTPAPPPAHSAPTAAAVAAAAARRRATSQHDTRPARTTQTGDAPLTAPSTASVVMLVGPTGAGKTTTIAKIAARAALIDGRRVGLVTLDNYRVGGVEQIRMFAELIGVPLEVAETPDALAELIDPGNDLTLIDTAGRSPRDSAAIAELAEHIAGQDIAIEVHLVIPAGSTADQVDELITRYGALNPTRLLFTKIDECERAPEVALAPARTHLPITWVTTGQAVPEDIETPTPARVLELASGGLAHNRTRAA
jgi:flagellar biosynthesis protein FlhF